MNSCIEEPLQKQMALSPQSTDDVVVGVADRFDKLSALSDKLLHHIFSFLGANDTVRLSTLSRKFYQLCVSSPYLYLSADFFEIPDVAARRQKYLGFCSYMDSLWSKRKSSEIKTKRFCFHWICKQVRYDVGVEVINSWLKGIGGSDDLQEFDLLLRIDVLKAFFLPKSLESFHSLRVLRLNLMMGKLCLPTLKNLDWVEELVLREVTFPNSGDIDRILSWKSLKTLEFDNVRGIKGLQIASDTLEKLVMSNCNPMSNSLHQWTSRNFRICGSSFKDLEIYRCCFDDICEVRLNCPSLQCVSVHGSKFNNQSSFIIECSALETLDVYGSYFGKVSEFKVCSPSVKHVNILNCDFKDFCYLSTTTLSLRDLIVADCEFADSDHVYFRSRRVEPEKKPCLVVRAEKLNTLSINSSDKYLYKFPLAFSENQLQNISWKGDPVEFMHLGLDTFRSLVSASIDIKPSCQHKRKEAEVLCKHFKCKSYCVANLIECLSCVKFLDINIWPIEILYMQKDEPIFRKYEVEMFPNLESLVLKTDKSLPEQIPAIAYFIQKLPNLRTITIGCDQYSHILGDPCLINLLGLNPESYDLSAGKYSTMIRRKDEEQEDWDEKMTDI